MSTTVSAATRFLAISAFALSFLPASLGAATRAAASVLDRGGADVVSDVRAAVLPDLRALDVKIVPAPGSTQKMSCVVMDNIGRGDAGPFTVAFTIDGVVPPGGTTSAGQLPSGQGGELCAIFALPVTPGHVLGATVDAFLAVQESDENNNFASRPIPGTVNGDVVPATPPTKASRH